MPLKTLGLIDGDIEPAQIAAVVESGYGAPGVHLVAGDRAGHAVVMFQERRTLRSRRLNILIPAAGSPAETLLTLDDTGDSRVVMEAIAGTFGGLWKACDAPGEPWVQEAPDMETNESREESAYAQLHR